MSFGYKPPIKSLNGWIIGGTHKAYYRVKKEDWPKIKRERVYIQCNFSLGYDHEAMLSDNPSYEEVVLNAK